MSQQEAKGIPFRSRDVVTFFDQRLTNALPLKPRLNRNWGDAYDWHILPQQANGLR